MRVRVKVVVVAHQILSEEDAGVEATSHFRVDLVGIVHQLFQFLGERDHGLGERREQPLNQIQIFVVLLALNHDSLSLEVVEGHLEVDLLELIHKPLSFLELVQLHCATANYLI